MGGIIRQAQATKACGGEPRLVEGIRMPTGGSASLLIVPRRASRGATRRLTSSAAPQRDKTDLVETVAVQMRGSWLHASYPSVATSKRHV